MTSKQVRDFIKQLWLDTPAEGIRIPDLHESYNVPNIEHIVLSKQEYVTLVSEAIQLGTILANLGEPKIFPPSLEKHKEVIRELYNKMG